MTCGFGVTAGATNRTNVNQSGYTYVAWCWKEAVKAGFDIATYTGTGAELQVAHSLGAVPDVIIARSRDSGTASWATYVENTLDSSSVKITDPETDVLVLDGNDILNDNSNPWFDTAPDASEFTVGASSWTNVNTQDHIAYLFKEIPGFSRFTYYAGNGSTDGPFVWCGFRPRFIITKRLHSAAGWHITDTARQYYNNGSSSPLLIADQTAAEVNSWFKVDVLSNGFKVRDTDSTHNASTGEYIVLAFAEHPFKYARAF